MSEMKVPALAGLASVEALTNPVVIGDLHLAPNKPKTIMAFIRFMKQVAPRYAELVILGDLFDYWLGDDAMTEAAPILAELKPFTQSGRRLIIMQGCSDALIGEAFARTYGAELLSDPAVLTVRGRRILFSHGDAWTIRNRAYQAYRNIVRDPDWQRQLLVSPVAQRTALFDEARARALELFPDEVSETDQMIIERVAAEAADAAGAELIIHGHMHRPGAVLTTRVERWCVPSWECDLSKSPRSGYLVFLEDGRPQVRMM